MHPADELLDPGGAQDRGVVDELLPLVGLAGELEAHRADDGAGRLGAAVEHEERLLDDLVLVHRADRPVGILDLGVRPHRDQVVGGILAPRREHLHASRPRTRGPRPCSRRWSPTNRRRPWYWPPDSIVTSDHSWHFGARARVVAEHLADDRGGQRRREVLDDLALAPLDDPVDELGHDAAHVVLVVLHRTRREAAGDEPALVLVERVVVVDHRLVGDDERA